MKGPGPRGVASLGHLAAENTMNVVSPRRPGLSPPRPGGRSVSLALLVTFGLFHGGCSKSPHAEGPEGRIESRTARTSGAAPAPATHPENPNGDLPIISLRLFDVVTGEVDPRFDQVPSILHRVELLPDITLLAETDETAGSVRFDVDGASRLDSEVPFSWSETEAGAPRSWRLPDGPHAIEVTAFSTKDGSGRPVARSALRFTLDSAGIDSSPENGAHTRHDFWKTGSGAYVTRNVAGDFVDDRGSVLLAGKHVELRFPEKEQGHLVTTKDGADTLEFAFIVLLPEGYDPTVKYPLLVFLHHGWDVYRGTDNDGRPLETPLFSGPRSLTQSSMRTRFPSVIVVPQLARKETVDGVEQEWGAFTDLDNEIGSVRSAPHPSKSGQRVLDLVEDMLSGRFSVGKTPVTVDSGRIYLAGHSMGGLGTWDLLARRPDLWAAGVPMAGYPDHEKADLLRETPIWSFHHERDCYNPFQGSQTMVRRVRAASRPEGSRIRFTRLTFDTEGKCDQAHFQTPNGAWNDEPGLFEWLFSQVRPRRESGGSLR